MDSIDKTIMFEFFKNCRISYEGLSRKTGLTATAVKNRVRALLDSGLISRFAVYLRASMIDADYFIALINTDGTEDVDEFVDRLGENPMVGHISLLASVQGGAYFLWGQYIGATMLSELRAYLQTPSEVQNIELHTIIGRHSVHTIIGHRREKVQLSKLHLRILSILRNNPRAPISYIAQNTGLAPKTVRRAIQELIDGEGIHFTARPDMAAGELVNFFLRLEWNNDEITMEEILKWLKEKFPIRLWDPMPLATEPVFFIEFVINDLREAEEIARTIQKKSFVKSTATLVSYSNKKYKYLPEIMLDDMIRDAGFE